MIAIPRFISFLSASTILAGCIGTEYIDDPVSPPAATRLVVIPSSVILRPGGAMQFRAHMVDGNGGSTPAFDVHWFSSDTSRVAVDSAGVAVARTIGQARIGAQVNTLTSDAALVTVVADQNQVARVEVAPQNVQRRSGESQQFTATAYNMNNQVIGGRLVSWSSSSAGVVSINASGLATAQSAGSASIVATIDSIESLPATFTVMSNVRTGMFVTRPGSGHPVQGTATLNQGSNGALVLSFGSNFSSAGGPDVRVYLSTTSSVGANSIDLGRLQRFTGSQSYNIPSGVQLSTYDWIIIHCVPFNITFGYARLQ
jgi:3D (Asp-Asp-Asp) domain-containing protein